MRIAQSEGLWNTIEKADLDGDGDEDFVLGNLGENNFFAEGLTIFINDFDQNGTIEQICCQATGDGHFPIHDIDELYSQMPILKKKYRTYAEFSQAPLEVLLPEDKLKEALQLQLRERRSMILWNNGGQLALQPLPRMAQYSTIHAVLIRDFNEDGTPDLLLGGNDYKYKPQFGRQDAGKGCLCYGSKKGEDVIFADCYQQGLEGQIRALEIINQNQIIVGINDGAIKVYEQH